MFTVVVGHILFVIGLLFMWYFGWKFNQSRGAEHLNELFQEYGGGEFGFYVKTKLMQLYWFVLFIIASVGTGAGLLMVAPVYNL